MFANEVNEDNAASYMALAFEPGATVYTTATVLSDADQIGSITVTSADTNPVDAHGVTAQTLNDGTQDYTSTTAQQVDLNTAFTIDTLDDWKSDNGEEFTVAIDTASYVADAANGGYENVKIDTAAVTTTILDDTGTPNDLPDGPEPDHEAVIIKLVACDVSGNPIFEADGKTYTYVNDAQEGSVAQYMAVAFAPDEILFTTDTNIAPDGTVKVTFTDGASATTATDATGAPTQGTTIDGSKDFDNSGQTVDVGTAFSTNIFDDYLKEGEHDYTVVITTDSYEPSSATTGYENVTESGSVVTTISDDEPGTGGTPPGDDTPNESIDTVYVKLTHNDSTIEGGILTHTVTLVDKDGFDITVPTGKSITVSLVYSSDGTLNADYTTTNEHVESGDITVTIQGGTNHTVINNDTLDDFTQEGTETYVLRIKGSGTAGDASGVNDVDGVYENILPRTTANGANGTNVSVTGEIIDGVYIGTPEDAYVDEDDFLDNDNNFTNLNSVERSEDIATDGNSETNLGVVASSSENSYTLSFDGEPTFTSDSGSFNTANGDNLTSNGNTIYYKVDGDTITAYDVTVDGLETDANRVFVIALDKHGAGGSDDDYSYTQYKNIDHPITLNNAGTDPIREDDDNIVLTFGFKVNDNGVSSNPVNFEVTVNDSLPSSTDQSKTLAEGGSKIIVISDESFAGGIIKINNKVEDASGNDAGPAAEQTLGNGAIVNIYDTDGNDIVGTLTNNGNGTVTFNPNTNYSGATNGFDYTVSDTDGDTASGSVNLTVTPVADTPNVNEGNVTTTEDNANTQEGTHSVALGLDKPTMSEDSIDENDGDITTGAGVVAGDHPERLGYIEMKFTNGSSVSGAIVEKADGTDLFTVSSNNQVVKIFISDDANYHHSDLDPVADGAIQLTTLEYQELQIIHAEDNAKDIKINLKITSYEVDDSGVPLVGVASKSDSDNMKVIIKAQTEDIELQWDYAPGTTLITTVNNPDDTIVFENRNEGEIDPNGSAAIDLQNFISKMSGYIDNTSNDESLWGGDLDGSEKRTYTIEGIPEGTIISIGGDNITGAGGTTAVAGVNGIATVTYTYEFIDDNTGVNIDNNPEFLMTFPTDYSGTITDGKIILSVQDIDSDYSGHNGTVKTAELFFGITVDAVAGEATISVNQPKGVEDAGRTGSNEEDATTGAGTIDNPANGIVVEIGVESSDSSETFTVTMEEIPNGGHMFYNGRLYNETGLVTDNTNTDATVDSNVSVTSTATGWMLVMVEYDETMPPKYIPVHNSNENVTVQVYAETVDTYINESGVEESDTNVVKDGNDDVIKLAVDIQVKGVADIPVNELLNENTIAGNTYALVLYETDGINTINLEDIYVNTGLDSYDNAGDEDSEALSVVLSGLSSEFSVSGTGATFIGGDGADRKWLIDKADIDQVDINIAGHFSGEVDFKVKYITTEDDGDSKTHPEQDVKVLINPIAPTDNVEAAVNTSTVVVEDTPAQLSFAIADDGSETLETVWIKQDDVDGQDFALFMGNSNIGIETLTPVTKDGVVSYELTGAEANSLHVIYGSDQGTANSTDFDFKYTVKDSVTLSDGTVQENTSAVLDSTYTFSLSALTDDISIDVADISKVVGANVVTTDTDADGVESVSLNGTGTFTVDVDITALTNDKTDADLDGSENVTRLVIEGVPAGVNVVGGVLGVSTGLGSFWFVDIDPDVVLDGSADTYQITFKVVDEMGDGTGDTSNVTITAYSHDTNSAADDIEMASTSLKFVDNIDNGSGGTPTTPVEAILDLQEYHATEDNEFAKDGNSAETSFTLADIVTVTADPNDGAGDHSHDGAMYSVTVSNLQNVSIDNATGINQINATTYVVTGTKDTIDAKLANISFKPDGDFNENNDSGSSLSIDAQLTAYMETSSHRNTSAVLTFEDAEVNAVTDTVVTSEVITSNAANGVDTLEDGTYNIDINLNTVDNPDFAFVDAGGNPVSIITVTHASGIDGTISWGGANAGSVDLSQGGTTSADIPFDQIDNITFVPAANSDGSVTLTYDVYTQETGATNIETSAGSVTLNVQAVADGLDLSQIVTTSGSEFTDGASKFTEILIGNAMVDNVDVETVQTMFIDGVPDGFLIYTGDSGIEAQAQNAGDNGSSTTFDLNGVGVGYNTWNIPLNNDGTVPKVWIVGPENWSGTVPNMAVVTYVNDNGSVLDTSTTFSLTIDAVASTITIDPTNTFANNYVWTAVNINANMTDLDGSETMTLTLAGAVTALDETAQFRLSDGSSVNATFNSGTWTLADVAFDEINNIEILYHEYSGTVNVTAKTVDGASVVDTTVSSVFEMNIAGTSTTGSGDETILTDGDFAINAGTGEDTITLTQGANLDSINYANLDNIETIDLDVNGAHTLANLKLSDIVSMTDVDNELTILGDSADSVDITNDLSMGTNATDWTLATVDNGADTTYTYSKNDGSDSITLKIDDAIHPTGM